MFLDDGKKVEKENLEKNHRKSVHSYDDYHKIDQHHTSLVRSKSGMHLRELLILSLVVFFSVFAVIVSSNRVTGTSVEVFDAWITSGEVISVDNDDFTVNYDPSADEIVVAASGRVVLVEEGACETTENLRFCFNDSDENHDTEYDVLLQIYRVEHDVSLIRTISATKFYLGETYDVTIVLENEGSLKLDSITIEENIPETWEIQSTSGCTQEGHKITWTGKLKQGTDYECEYSFKPVSLGKYTTKTKAEYFDGYKTQEIYSTSKTIEPQSYFHLLFKTNVTKPELYEPIRVYFNITNNGEKELDLKKLEILLPDYSEVIKTGSKITQEEGKYVWIDEDLGEDETLESYIDIKLTRTGHHAIYVKGNYDYDRINYELPLTYQEFEITKKDLIVTNTLQDNYVNLLSSELVEFKVRVENPYSYENLTDVNVDVTTDLMVINKGAVNEIIENGRRTLLDVTFYPPYLEKSKKYPVIINVTAKTLHGEEHNIIKRFSRTVSPVQQLKLNTQISDKTIEEGDEIRIKVTVVNPNNQNYSNVKVFDKSSEDLVKKGLTSHIFTDLGKKKTETAYQYTIIAPEVSKETNYTIESIMQYLDNGLAQESKQENLLTISPKSLDLKAVYSITGEKFIGKRTTLSLTVTNNDVETAYNITFMPPVSQDYMSSGEKIVIPELNPGESTKKELTFLIPLKKGTVSINQQEFIFWDSDGNKFTDLTAKANLAIEPAQPSGIVLWIEKIYIRTGNHIDFYVNITNNGTQTANLTYEYEKGAGQYDNLSLRPKETKTIFYSKELTTNQTEQPTHIFFTDFFGEIHAYSNELTFIYDNTLDEVQNEELINDSEQIINDTLEHDTLEQNKAAFNTTLVNEKLKPGEDIQITKENDKKEGWFKRKYKTTKEFFKELISVFRTDIE